MALVVVKNLLDAVHFQGTVTNMPSVEGNEQ